ncbi:putative ribonuclease H-like domain-containing protein [Tanacetum coccineum]
MASNGVSDSENSEQESDVVSDKKTYESKENSNESLVKEQVSKDISSFVESSLNVDKETVFPVNKKVEFAKPKNHEKLVKKLVSGCSRHMIGNIAYLSDFKEFDKGYVTFRGGAHGGRISSKGTLKTDSLDFDDVYFVNELKFNLFSVSQMCDKKNYVLFTDIEFKDKYPCKEVCIQNVLKYDIQTCVACLKGSITGLLAEAVSTACYVQNRVLVVKPHNKTPYEIFRGFKPALSFMKPFRCHVTILNTLDSLGKFDVQCDEVSFVGYSLSSKAFRVYNTRTRRVEENLHIRFLENKPMIEENGPKWLFDIDSLTQSMNYVPVATGTIINEFVGTQGELNVGTSEEISQDYIVEDGLDNENDEKDKSDDDSSPKEVNTAGQHFNTASPNITTDSPKYSLLWRVVISLEALIQNHVHCLKYTGLHLGGSNVDELYNFNTPKQILLLVDWTLMERGPIGTKLVFRNKMLNEDFDWYKQEGRLIRHYLSRSKKGDILLVQVYVDDIIFGSTNKELCTGFKKLMKDKFQMSSMGELTFFLGLQVQQKDDGIFISHDKYVAKILKKFNYTDVKSVLTLVEWKSLWSKMEMLMMLMYISIYL